MYALNRHLLPRIRRAHPGYLKTIASIYLVSALSLAAPRNGLGSDLSTAVAQANQTLASAQMATAVPDCSPLGPVELPATHGNLVRLAAVEPGRIYRGSAPYVVGQPLRMTPVPTWPEDNLLYLKSLGIKTIVDLTDSDEGSDLEHTVATRLGFSHFQGKIDWERRMVPYQPTDQEIASARLLAANPPPGFADIARAIIPYITELDKYEAARKTDPKAVPPKAPLIPIKFPTDASIHRIMEVVENKAAQPIYIHCVLGRDRTGLIVALHRLNTQMSADDAYQEMQSFGFNPSIIMEGLHRYLYYSASHPESRTPTGGPVAPEGLAQANPLP